MCPGLCRASEAGAAARWSGWRSRACLRMGLLEAKALEGHVEVAQVESRVEKLRKLPLGQPLANLGALPDGRLEVRSPVERADSRPLYHAVGILSCHPLLHQGQQH